MARLTERRFLKIKPVLDEYNSKFLRTQYLDAGRLEMELKKLLNLGYQELKDVMIDLSNRSGYTLLAARYMEDICPCVVSEFKDTLAMLYGIRRYDSAEREIKQKEYWDRQFGRKAAEPVA